MFLSTFKALLLTAALFLGGGYSHVEDYVIQDGTGTIINFYEESTAIECMQGERSPRCVALSILQGGDTFQAFANFRGVVHYDGVFIMAQAVGFSRELAYWIAAFSQSADFVQFKALDSCGRTMPKEYWTPPLRGFLRISTVTGGAVRHLGLPFGLNKPSEDYTGLDPDFNNFEYEGTLSVFRLWARGEIDTACHGGFREPVSGNYFDKDQTCLSYPTKLQDEGVRPFVSGPIPLAGGPMGFGEQIVHYECLDDPNCEGDENQEFTVINEVLASDFGEYLAGREEAKLENGEGVPEVIARIGIYMHMLADRASHYYCSDVDGTGIYLRDDDVFDTILDTVKCNFVSHSLAHYWEDALEHPLAPESYAALRLYYQELLSFRQLVESDHPDWFVRAPDAFSDLVGTDADRGPLDSAFVIVNGQDRYDAVLDVMDEFGYDRPPGFEVGSTQCCPQPEAFIKVSAPSLPPPSMARVAIADCIHVETTCVVVLTGEQYARRYGDKKNNKDPIWDTYDALFVSLSPSCISGKFALLFIKKQLDENRCEEMPEVTSVSFSNRKNLCFKDDDE